MDPVQAAKLEKWIRNKYELRLFVVEGSVDPKSLVLAGKDPRHTEPYGRALVEPVSPKSTKSPRKGERAVAPASPKRVNAIASVSPPPTAALDPVSPAERKQAETIVLPTTFNWRDNIFLASWAQANAVL